MQNNVSLVICPDCGKRNLTQNIKSGKCSWCYYQATLVDVIYPRKGEVY